MITSVSQQNAIIVRPSKVYSALKGAKWGVLGLLFFVGAIYLHNIHFFNLEYPTAIAGCLYIIFSLYKYAQLQCTLFEITEEQIKSKTGVFSKRTDFLEMYRIKDYIINEPLLFRLFGLMNFTILSVDKNTQNKEITMKGIVRSDLPDVVRALVQKARLRNGVIEIDNGRI